MAALCSSIPACNLTLSNKITPRAPKGQLLPNRCAPQDGVVDTLHYEASLYPHTDVDHFNRNTFNTVYSLSLHVRHCLLTSVGKEEV